MMKKIYAVIFFVCITACTNSNFSNDVLIKNKKDESIYVKIDGLSNEKYHKLVFIQHGLASNMEHQAIQAAKKAFLDNKYMVITFDTRHSLGKSDNDVKKVRLATFENDLETVIQWAQTQPFYNNTFALVGHSLGGASVIEYSAKYPKQVNILVPITPVISGQQWEESCMANMTKFCNQWKQKGTYEYKDTKKHKTAIIPFDVIISSKSYNAYNLAPKIKAQTLLIAAQNDNIIAPNDVQKLAKLIPSQAKTVVIAESGHNFEQEQNQIDLYNKIKEFIK